MLKFCKKIKTLIFYKFYNEKKNFVFVEFNWIIKCKKLSLVDLYLTNKPT